MKTSVQKEVMEFISPIVRDQNKMNSPLVSVAV